MGILDPTRSSAVLLQDSCWGNRFGVPLGGVAVLSSSVHVLVSVLHFSACSEQILVGGQPSCLTEGEVC